MSNSYKFKNPERLYFISFATIGWIDVFTRNIYRDIVVQSLRYCQEYKGLDLYAWVIMTNHLHVVAEARAGFLLQNIIRDLKRHTSKQILKTTRCAFRWIRFNFVLDYFTSFVMTLFF